MIMKSEIWKFIKEFFFKNFKFIDLITEYKNLNLVSIFWVGLTLLYWNVIKIKCFYVETIIVKIQLRDEALQDIKRVKTKLREK